MVTIFLFYYLLDPFKPIFLPLVPISLQIAIPSLYNDDVGDKNTPSKSCRTGDIRTTDCLSRAIIKGEQMKKIRVTFRSDPDRKDIDIVFTASEMDENVISLMKRVSDPLADTLTVYDSFGCAVALPQDHIISISSDKKKLKVVAEEGTYELRQPLRDIENRLHPVAFLKISRYEIIHLVKVRKFDFSITGSLRIEMKNGMETWASRRFISEIRKRLLGKE
jgi:hypothetical protein